MPWSAWVKLLLPLISEYLKEIFFPGKEAKNTSVAGRVAALVIIALLGICAFLADAVFTMYDEKVTLKADLASKNMIIEDNRQSMDELKEQFAGIKVQQCTVVPVKSPPYNEQKNKPRKAAVREEDITLEQRIRIMHEINGS